ncbi:unnamed protein product [Withania somnifera]
MAIPLALVFTFIAYHLYYRLPPGPTPWPVVGNSTKLSALDSVAITSVPKITALIISVWFVSNLNVVISSSELAKEVLKGHDQHLANRHNMGKSLPVRKYIGAVAFNNITRLAFGKRFVYFEGVMDEQGNEFKAIVANGLKLGASLTTAEHIPWLRWMFPLDEDDFSKHGERRDRLTQAIMENTLARQKSGAKQHFFDALLTLQQKYDLSEDTLVGLLWDMITAGMDTTAISIEWAMANPRVQQKPQEELDQVIGYKREALRMHPPTPLMLPHKSNANVKIGGYDFPKGSNVQVNVWAFARDPKVWKNPLEFRPERLLTLGAGRRVCPGTQLGINLVTCMLGHLLHHFHWAPSNGLSPEDIDMSENPGLVSYLRTPLQADATPRLPAELYKRIAVDM